MDSRKIAIYLIAKELGVDFDKFEGDFNQRLVFQKLMYIAFQSSKFESISCRYGLYKKGPYSPELAHIGYEIYRERKSLNNPKLNENGKKCMNELKGNLPPSVRTITDKKEYSSDELNKLEAIATLIMACKNYQFPDLNSTDYRKLLNEVKTSIFEDFNLTKKGLVEDETLEELFREAADYLDKNMSRN